eukprot:1188576-Pleurochrysis_carterae.AAC.1
MTTRNNPLTGVLEEKQEIYKCYCCMPFTLSRMHAVMTCASWKSLEPCAVPILLLHCGLGAAHGPKGCRSHGQ